LWPKSSIDRHVARRDVVDESKELIAIDQEQVILVTNWLSFGGRGQGCGDLEIIDGT
jgi:hypothetical protein